MDLSLNLKSGVPRLKELLAADPVGNIAMFVNEAGERTKTEGLFKSADLAIILATVPSGMQFERHVHTETEWIIVVSGELTYRDSKKEIKLHKSQGVAVPAGRAHSVEAGDEDVVCVALTIPANEAFPDGPRSG